MKRRTLLAILAILGLVTLACGLTGGSTDEEVPEAAQPPAESGGEQPPAESGGEQPTSAPESGGGAPEIAGLDTLNSYRLHMTWRGENEDGSESYEMNILEEWVKEPPARHLAMSTSVAGSEERPVLEMIRIGDTTWIKMGETWIQSESPDESAMGEGLSNAWEGFLAGDLEGWGLVGEETVNGVHCKHYATDDETTITVPDPQGGGTVTTHVQGETWVADQPGLPPVTVRERSQMEGGFFPMPLAGGEAAGETGTVHWEFDVTDINAPITIEPPGEASEMPSLPSVSETPTSPPEAAAPPEPAAANTAVRPADGMEMILIPAGEFLMGTDESPFAHERPAHLVTLDEYWMDRTEMTNGRYRLCVEAGVCAEPKSWEDSNLNGDDQPALVPWEAAQAYCGWVGGRLPAEAEWEKAARGTDGRTWPWGNEFEPGRANLSDDEDGYGFTAPVGSFPTGASPYGLLDLAGNAAEWVADWYDPEYYAHSAAHNPTGPASGDQKLVRGTLANGGGGPEKCRCIARFPQDPARWEFGFRCVAATLPQP